MSMFAERIKQERSQRGWTKKYLSSWLGISPKTLTKYENNESMPNIETLIKIAQVMEVSVDYLVGNSEYRSVGQYQTELVKLSKIFQDIINTIINSDFDNTLLISNLGINVNDSLVEENKRLRFEIVSLQAKLNQLVLENGYTKELPLGL